MGKIGRRVTGFFLLFFHLNKEKPGMVTRIEVGKDNSSWRKEESEAWQCEIVAKDHPKYKVVGHLSTVVGTRANQQDACYVSVEKDSNAIGVVCDGMGGMWGGEIASRVALQTFVEDFEGVRYRENDFYNFFCEEMKKIDQIVADLEDDGGRALSAGTTFLAASIVENRLRFVSVGDSKLYIIRGEKIQCVNREHNYLMLLKEQYQRGEITGEVFWREKSKGAALISYLGMGNVDMIDVTPRCFRLREGDIVVLCSDGLYKALTEDQILAIVRKNPIHLEKTLQELQTEAKTASGISQDNTSIVMMSCRRNADRAGWTV
ncbi:MAG: protein phosphatase 2C domain-containing protein [Eubacteriales bacterium]|nr:protein phosphatase 2C domain-containing protein [Eubacteriales bacterium]